VGPAGLLNPQAVTLARESKLVASAGFDTDGSTPGRVTRAGIVRASGFGETAGVGTGRVRSLLTGVGFSDAPPEQAIRPRQQRQNYIPAEGVEILEKPQPVYSEEGRRLRIEGEVLLRVRFGASGDVEVLGVIRGLGHGLDERAAAAARGIRFRPARHDGLAVDSTAIVHVLFQLAS
jgi:TonB family protein